MAINGGYILLARKITESGIMDKPPLYFKLWVWMLEQANHKDGYKGLTRGQFFTTIEDMREAMAWHVGYRKVKPSRKEIRNPYEWFMKGHMIDIAKGTHGMVITILKYGEYQNPKNYEGHNEGPHGGNTKGQRGAQYKQEGEECKNVNKTFSSEQTEFRLAKYLFNHIKRNNPAAKEPNFQTWAKHIDYMIRIDKRDPEEIKAVIEWCQKDSFWHANILSAKKLREKYDQLVLKMGNTRVEHPLAHFDPEEERKRIEDALS